MTRPLRMIGLLLLAAAPAGAANDSLLDLVPSNATVMVHVRDVAAMTERWAATPFGRMWEDPEIEAFFAPLRAELEADTRGDEASRFAAALDEITGDLVVFFPGLDQAIRSEGDDVVPPVVVIAAVGSDTTALERFIRDLAEHDEDDESVWETREFAGVEINVERRRDGDDDGGVSWTVTDGLLALASTPTLLERTIKDIRSGATDSALATSTTFASTARLIGEGDATVFVDIERLVPSLRAVVADQLPTGQSPIPLDGATLLDALGLDELRAGFARVAFSASEVALDMGITFASNRGLVRLLSYGPGEAPRPRFIPADAPTFGSAKFDFQESWRAVEEIVNGINPALLAMAGAQLTAMIQNAGVELDLRRDLLDNLSGEVTMIQTSPTAAAPEDPDPGALQQNQVIALAIEQRQSFELAIETLKTMAGSGSQLFEQREFLGFEIFTLALPGGVGSVAYTITDDQFLLAFGDVATLEAVLVAMTSRGPSAWDQPRVRRALDLLPGRAAAINYQDLAVTGRAMFEAMATLASLDAGGDLAICDPDSIPSSKTIARYLGPALTTVSRDGGSLVVRGRMLAAESAPR